MKKVRLDIYHALEKASLEVESSSVSEFLAAPEKALSAAKNGELAFRACDEYVVLERSLRRDRVTSIECERIASEFAAKVHGRFIRNGWKWYFTGGERVPTIDEIKETALSLLESVANEQSIESWGASGGRIRAYRDENDMPCLKVEDVPEPEGGFTVKDCVSPIFLEFVREIYDYDEVQLYFRPEDMTYYYDGKVKQTVLMGVLAPLRRFKPHCPEAKTFVMDAIFSIDCIKDVTKGSSVRTMVNIIVQDALDRFSSVSKVYVRAEEQAGKREEQMGIRLVCLRFKINGVPKEDANE